MTRIYSISEPVDVKYRIIVDGAIPVYARLFGHLRPSDNGAGIQLTVDWKRDDCEQWLVDVEIGIQQFVQSRIEAGMPVGNTEFIPHQAEWHEIATTHEFVTRTTREMLRSYFKEAGLGSV